MRVDVITVFPDYLAPLELGVLGRARRRGLLDLRVHDLRRWTHDAHRTVDDAPYGGSPGMLMLAGPWFAALREVTGAEPRAQGDTGTRPGSDGVYRVAPAHRARPLVVVPSPCGRRFDQSMAVSLAIEPWLVICCGRYEGIDQRVLDAWADLELSIGDYVLAGGEAAALVLLEVTGRLLPGVLGNAGSAGDDSFSTGLLEAPAYTRPAVVEGREVPPVLLSGDHAAVARWRHEQSLARTRERRPDLLDALPPGSVAQ
jgi:tRNA (guanine37-N1)-methyltransferase